MAVMKDLCDIVSGFAEALEFENGVEFRLSKGGIAAITVKKWFETRKLWNNQHSSNELKDITPRRCGS